MQRPLAALCAAAALLLGAPPAVAPPRAGPLADSATTVNDLNVSDFSSKTDKKAGHWTQDTGTAATDKITLNVTLIAGNSAEMRRNVLVHELEHAHGFCHKSDGGKSAVQSVMWANASAHGVPTEVDKANYRKLWGS